MDQPGLIGGYLAELSASLPAPIVDELADGLDQTYQRYRGEGLGRRDAARAALAEFGEPRVIVAAFTRASPARKAARRLLAAGPAVGACWAAALLTSRAWTWPVPALARTLVAAALITVIGLLAFAAFSGHYRLAGRAAAAACGGLITLDLAMLVTVALAVPTVRGMMILAAAASAARILVTVRSLAPALLG
ncbi:MAG: hypothetical protein J2P34_10310 [Actinobacteria bacterium]|nr:hypothetical protein [Actinomycetota bacterium]